MSELTRMLDALEFAHSFFEARAQMATPGSEGAGKLYECAKGCADAIALLKAQEPATVEPKRIELADETKAWLDEMDAVDALGNIADICIDWDGYRTADGLGGLINEIWAYARYCADRIAKAQEPVMVEERADTDTVNCPKCGQQFAEIGRDKSIYLDADEEPNYCPKCGQAVKWE